MDVESAVVTLWYVTAEDCAAVLAAEPRADRGFGRKFLAQLNPSLPVTPIGQFPLNRSAQPGESEYYVGAYPGVAVVQTIIEGEELILSRLPKNLLGAIPARDVYAFSCNAKDGYAGFAHWRGGELKRSLCATRLSVYEDEGLPEPFEAPFWAGERAEQREGIWLPFEPRDIAEAAQEYWLGTAIGKDGPDVDVVGYATDGRPEPKVAQRPPRRRSVSDLAASSAARLGFHDYDDYEAHEDEDPDAESTSAELWRTARLWGGRAGRVLGRLAAQSTQAIKDRWRS